MKRKTVIFLVILLMSAVFTFAGGQSDSVKENEEGPVTLTFWVPKANDIQDNYFKKVADEFSRLNTDINIEIVLIPADSESIIQKLNTAKLGGTYPDIQSAFLMFIGDRGARGEFLNLQPYVDSWSDKNDILDSTLDLGMYKGDFLGFGYYPAPTLRVYRKDFFEEAGLDPENPPSTWEGIYNAAIKCSVYDNDGNLIRAGMDVPTSPSAIAVFAEPFMRQAGSLVCDEKKQELSIADEGGIKAFEFMKKLWDANVSFPHKWTAFDTHPFLNNRSAMGNIFVSHLQNMIKEDPELEDKLGIMPVLEGPVQRKAFNGYRFFVINSETQYPDESWEFMKYMMSSDQMWERYKLLAIPPVRKSLMEKFINDSPERNTLIASYVENGKGRYIAPWTGVADVHFGKAYEEVLNGVKSPEQALKDAQNAANKEIDQLGLR